MRPFRRGPKADEPRADLIGDFVHLAQVFVHLVAGLVDRLQRRAAEFQLATRFQRHVRAVLDQTDDVAALQHRIPAEPVA